MPCETGWREDGQSGYLAWTRAVRTVYDAARVWQFQARAALALPYSEQEPLGPACATAGFVPADGELSAGVVCV